MVAWNNIMDSNKSFVVSSIDEGNWDENQTSWDERLTSVEWQEKGAKSTVSPPSFSKLFQPTTAGWLTFDITAYKDKEEFDILIYCTDDIAPVGESQYMAFKSNQYLVVNARPYITFRFREWSVDSFKSQDEKLTVSPYSQDPVKPELKWGKIDNWDRYTATKIYRKTSAFSKPSEGTLVATFTDITKTSWVDDSVLTNGQQYFYIVSIEGTYNAVDSSTYSNCASFTKPDITSTSFYPSSGFFVGGYVDLTVNSLQYIKRVWVDWKDGCQSWYDFETVALSQTIKHYFPSVVSGIPEVRIESNVGFWSDKESTSVITVADSNPVAKLVVNEGTVIRGETVVLSGIYSQSMGANTYITNYLFSLDGGTTYSIDNGDNPVYELDTSSILDPYIDIALKVISSSGEYAVDVSTRLYLIDGTPEELIFSQNTKVEEITHSLSMLKSEKIPIGSDKVEYDFLMSRRADVISLSMSTATPHLESDMRIIREAFEQDKYVRIKTRSEYETKEITYDGTIVGDVEIVQQFQGVVVWNWRLKVINMSEAFIPGMSGVITAVASGGTGLLTITSANHGLTAGEEIAITTTDGTYNGGNQVISVISASQFRVRGIYSATKTGSWMKKPYA
jgi:hypothetical protein